MSSAILQAVKNRAIPIKVIRQGKGTVKLGRWEEGPRDEIPIMAAVQNPTGEDLQKIEEGRRTEASIKLYSDFQFRTASVKDQRQPDLVLWGGDEYQIDHVENWTGDGCYYKAIATKRGQ